MATVDKDQIIAKLELLEKATLSPNMLELIRVTIDTLKDGLQPKSQKALNTWTHMLAREALPPHTRRQVVDTINLLKRIKGVV